MLAKIKDVTINYMRKIQKEENIQKFEYQQKCN